MIRFHLISFSVPQTPLRTKWLMAAVATGVLLSGSAFAQKADAGVGGAAMRAALPDAPAAALAEGHPGPAGVGGANDVPLQDEPHPEPTVKALPKHMFWDGVHIAISPAYLRKGDLKWMLPLAGAAAASLATDTKTMTQVVSANPSFNQTAMTVSDRMRDGFIALPAAMFVVGQMHGSEHARETGLLGVEAIGDASIVDEVVKLASFRERPLADHGRGEFYVGSAGLDSSFVSGHSMIAWSSAAVIAGEYRSKWVQAGVYTAATGVSLTRVLGQQHFPTDVLLGAAGGWLIGHYVFRAHHHWKPRQH
jgi:membrane-associated phospholipid phosphatase